MYQNWASKCVKFKDQNVSKLEIKMYRGGSSVDLSCPTVQRNQCKILEMKLLYWYCLASLLEWKKINKQTNKWIERFIHKQTEEWKSYTKEWADMIYEKEWMNLWILVL